MPSAPRPRPPLSDAEIGALQALLDALPAPLDPLDVSALDGFLAAVALRRPVIPEREWLAFTTDIDGRALPPGCRVERLHALARRRHAELDAAIEQRTWIDPWVFELDDAASPSQAVAGWVAGFSCACERFDVLGGVEAGAAAEALALLYRHLDPEDLEDADDIEAELEALEPPADLAEAVDDLIRATLLLADLTRPRSVPSARRRTAPRRPRRRRVNERAGPALRTGR